VTISPASQQFPILLALVVAVCIFAYRRRGGLAFGT
jgi:hypothetical protein